MSSLLLSPGQSHVLSISREPRVMSLHGPSVFLLVTLSKSMSSASRLLWSQSFNYFWMFTFGLYRKVSTSSFQLSIDFVPLWFVVYCGYKSWKFGKVLLVPTNLPFSSPKTLVKTNKHNLQRSTKFCSKWIFQT